MNQVKIGSFIKQKRIEKGLTQQQLAEIMNVSQKTVSRWETGYNMPDISLLSSLSAELGVSVSSLLAGEEKPIEEEAKIYNALNYGLNEKRMLADRIKKTLVIALIISLIVLADSAYGYLTTFTKWSANGHMFKGHGLIFGLIFGNNIINNDLAINMTRMTDIFIFILIINVVLLIALLALNLYTGSFSKGSKYEKG